MSVQFGRAVLMGAMVTVLSVSALYAQASGVSTDPATIKRGKDLWSTKACMGCHTIGKGRSAGPDLMGVLDRRSLDWVQRWLHDPPAMQQSDSTARALVLQFNNTKMPNLQLADAEVTALIAYIADQGKKMTAKSR
jgi:mono/diheme cytochrome c family protein